MNFYALVLDLVPYLISNLIFYRNILIFFPLFSLLEDYGIFTSTPSIIGKDGIEKSNTLDLENSEKLKLENSIQVIKTAIGNL